MMRSPLQSLVPLEWATEYFATSRPKAAEWDVADDTERQRYLGWASALIKSAFVWQPHVDIYDDDRIRVAVCEQALWLMRRADVYPEALTKGIASASAGVMSATFSKDFVAPLICEEAKLAVAEIGSFVREMAIVKTMPLGGVFAEPTSTPPISPPKNNGMTLVPMGQAEVEKWFNNIFQ